MHMRVLVQRSLAQSIPLHCAPRNHETHTCTSVIAHSCGGVIMMSSDGRIVVRNTLEDRLRITYEANLPVVRAQLFDRET